MAKSRPCPCGSGKDSYWQNDARGIPLCRTCDDCHDEKMKTYRPDVLTNPRYEADEPIDEDCPYPATTDRERFGSDY